MVVEMKAYAGMHNLLPPWMERGTLRALGSFSGKRIKMPERSQSNQSQYSQLGHGNQFTIQISPLTVTPSGPGKNVTVTRCHSNHIYHSLP